MVAYSGLVNGKSVKLNINSMSIKIIINKKAFKADMKPLRRSNLFVVQYFSFKPSGVEIIVMFNFNKLIPASTLRRCWTT